GATTELASVTSACTLENLSLDVDIAGSNIGDMQLSLTSPLGSVIVLHDLTGGDAGGLQGSYPGTLTSAQSLQALVGEQAEGDWQLSASAATYAKSIQSWQLHLF